MRPFLRKGQRENNGPLKLRFCQSQPAISPEVMPCNKTGLMINFLYFVIFLMTSHISVRFHVLPGLSQHRPPCSLENQVGRKLQSICEWALKLDKSADYWSCILFQNHPQTNLVPRAFIWGRGETRERPGLGRSILHSDWLTAYCLKITELDSWQY
jgi:hypothetical protein